jgi:hypothetical protein
MHAVRAAAALPLLCSARCPITQIARRKEPAGFLRDWRLFAVLLFNLNLKLQIAIN